MIKSMTGFGRGENTQDNRRFAVEIKAVNHRYFEPNIKLPRNLSMFEPAMRTMMKKYIERGKVDVFVTYDDLSEENKSLHYNEGLAAQYLAYYKKMSAEFDIDMDVRASALGRCPEVFTIEEQKEDEEQIWAVLEKALEKALEMFVEARQTEGNHLKNDLLAKLEHMHGNVELVEQRYPAIVEAYTNRLKEKVATLLGDTQIEESRLAEEIVLFSDKICTDEETVRLKSHINTMAAALKSGGAVGRKLDFIAQEMNREANTILSKANDLETSNIAIELKTEIEKVREQIQNIE